MMTLVFYPYVYLLAARRLSRPGLGRARDRPQPRPLAPARLPRGHPAAGPPLPRRRRGAGDDGGPGRLRHRGHLRLSHPHRRHLPRLVRDVRSGGGRPAGERAAPLRGGAARDRARLAGPAAVHPARASRAPRPRRSSCAAAAPPPPPSPAPRCSGSPSSCRWASSRSGPCARGPRAAWRATSARCWRILSAWPPSPRSSPACWPSSSPTRGGFTPRAPRAGRRASRRWAMRCRARSSRWAS